MERNCTNCVFCERFKYSPNDKTEMMRCWREPGAYDYAFVQSIIDVEDYVCNEHRTKKEREKELFEKKKADYVYYKRYIKKLEEKYPSLKDLI